MTEPEAAQGAAPGVAHLADIEAQLGLKQEGSVEQCVLCIVLNTHHELDKRPVLPAADLHQEVPGCGHALQQLAEVGQQFELGF